MEGGLGGMVGVWEEEGEENICFKVEILDEKGLEDGPPEVKLVEVF